MPLQATSGAASYDAYGGGVAVVPTYIEDVFSCFLYTGNGSTGQSINNGIDLSTKGGLVWIKDRANAQSHALFDTNRGTYNLLSTNNTTQQVNYNPEGLTAFNTTGFSVADSGGYLVNTNTRPYASWTFRKQPKFFDVVTYTGNGVSGRSISHNLGSDVGVVIIKKTSAAGDWIFWHRSLSTYPQSLLLNTTDAAGVSATYVNGYVDSTTSTTFTVNAGSDDADINASGATYVAYLFAHNAGGFGLTGTDNVISCGTYTGTSAVGNDQNLGFEPQWILIKRNTAGRDWEIIDNMRGWATNNVDARLQPNLSNAESTSSNVIDITSTGFNFSASGATSLNTSGVDYYYIAIRRGPMKVPTTGTSVFAPIARTGNDTETKVTGVGFSPDLWMAKSRNISADFPFFDRLRGVTKRVVSNSTYLEESFSGSNGLVSLDMDGITIGAGATDGGICNDTGTNYANLLFKRAPSFMDIVCYTGTASAKTINHNLGVAPELIITKVRSVADYDWAVYAEPFGATKFLLLNLTYAGGTDSTYWNNTAPTSSVFSVGANSNTNLSGGTLVAYLFATCAGVSKVFSYTGNGSSQTINCGFTTGARFVLIKRTGSTGDWYVWDTARGIVAGNDPHLSLNTTAAEVTTDDTIDTDNTGFVVNQVTATNVNVSSATYIGLAVA